MFYHITARTLNPLFLTQEYYREAEKTWLCPACKSVRIKGAVDAYIQGLEDKLAINIVMGASISIARVDFLECLNYDIVQSQMFLGKVFDAKGSLLTGYVTVRGKHMSYIRGNKESNYRKCETCKTDLYFPMGKRYLGKGLPDGVSIAESQFNSVIVSEELYKKIDFKRWKKIGADKLEVLSPMDGMSLDI